MVSLLDRTFTEKDARFRVVQTCSDGRAALEWLSQNPADLVVLDVYMPLFTGLELLHALRERDIAVDAIMVTAANDAATVDQLLKLGVVDFLIKPFTYERFQQALDSFCRHREAIAGDAVTQGALDKLFSPGGTGNTVAKGLQESTLELIRRCLQTAPPQGTKPCQTEPCPSAQRRHCQHPEGVKPHVEAGPMVGTQAEHPGGRPQARRPAQIHRADAAVGQYRRKHPEYARDERRCNQSQHQHGRLSPLRFVIQYVL